MRQRLVVKAGIAALMVALAATACFAQEGKRYTWQIELTADEFDAQMAAALKDGRRLICVDGSGPVDDPRFAVVWVRDKVTSWEARHGLSSEQYTEQLATLRKRGFRPLCVDAYGAYPREKYVVVWLRANTAWQAEHRLTSDGYQRAFTKHSGDGYVAMWVSALGGRSDARFSAIWVKESRASSGAHGRTPRNYLGELKRMRERHMRPLCQGVYGEPGDLAFASVSTRATALDWQARSGYSAQQFGALAEEMETAGYHPEYISSYDSGPRPAYSSIWEKNDVARTWQITGAESDSLKPFDDIVTQCMEVRRIPRAALAVTRGSRLVLARGYTWAPEDAAPTQPDSLFRIASLSKPLTAVGCLKLVQAGKIGLDQKASEIIDLSGATDPRISQVTVRHLLHHWGGWDRDASFDPMFRDRVISRALGRALPTTPQMVIDYMKTQRLDHDPGTKYAYSNFGYCMLGRVIDAASGRGYEDYMRDEVLRPVGITSMRIAKALKSDRREGEVDYDDPEESMADSVMGPGSPNRVPPQYGGWNIATMDAHGGWLASAVDLVRFAAALDDRANSPLLSEAMIEAMWSPPPWEREPGAVFYGCGWSVRKVEKGINTWHTGKLGPGTSTLLVRRWDGLNWAILFNSSYEPPNMSVEGNIDRMLHVAAGRVKDWPEGTALFGE